MHGSGSGAGLFGTISLHRCAHAFCDLLKREICTSLRIVFFASKLLQRNARAGCESLLISINNE